MTLAIQFKDRLKEWFARYRKQQDFTLPIEFKKCPVCGTKETVCRVACAGDPAIPEGTFVSLDKVIVPIQDINKISTPTVRSIFVHYDVCAKCGTRYCTRADFTSIPVTIQHRPGSVTKNV